MMEENGFVDFVCCYKNYQKDKKYYKIFGKLFYIEMTKKCYFDQMKYYIKNKYLFLNKLYKNIDIKHQEFYRTNPSNIPFQVLETYFLSHLNEILTNINVKTDFNVKIKRNIFNPMFVEENELKFEMINKIRVNEEKIYFEEEIMYERENSDITFSNASNHLI